jgi:hypothetical protein
MKTILIICGIIVLLICFFVIADRLFYSSFVKQSKLIQAQNELQNTEVITEESLRHLPEPVARYMRYSGMVGKKRISSVRLIHSGSFRPGADKAFVPIKGEYYLTSDKPSFCWYGKISMAPGLTVAAFDSYYNGKGRMLVKMMSVFKIVDDCSEVTCKSAFGRLVTEMTMIPSFFLDTDRITWTSSDSAHAECIIKDAGLQTTARLFFKAGGALEKVVVERYYGKDDGSSTLEKFTGTAQGSRNYGGLILPEIFDGYWNLKVGDLHYVHFIVDSVEYN